VEKITVHALVVLLIVLIGCGAVVLKVNELVVQSSRQSDLMERIYQLSRTTQLQLTDECGPKNQ
jgi:hypothetical protein